MSKEQLDERKQSGEKIRGGEVNEQDTKMSEVLGRIAEELGDGATVTSVAIAWAFHKHPYVFPISAWPRDVLADR
jgi:aryl-alcohol dehydrogenase-like predicted oxidoreductase